MLEEPLKHNYQYVVENDTVKNAVAKIIDILEKENEASATKPTVFKRLETMIAEIIEKNYFFFVQNWGTNIKTLKDNGLINRADYEKFDPKAKLITTLTNRLYHRNLAHGKFKDLLEEIMLWTKFNG